MNMHVIIMILIYLFSKTNALIRLTQKHYIYKNNPFNLHVTISSFDCYYSGNEFLNQVGYILDNNFQADLSEENLTKI
jgi:hypothetical protein